MMPLAIKKWLFLIAIYIVPGREVIAQHIFICRQVHISFFSSAPVEDIAATTDQAVSAINLQTGTVYFKVPIRSFQFARTLMKEHFNTDYMESSQYPFAEFKGKIMNYKRPDHDGAYKVTVKGDLTIHGVTKTCQEEGTLEIGTGKVTATSSFNVRIADHNVKIPKIVFKNIAEIVDVKVNAVYTPQKQANSDQE